MNSNIVEVFLHGTGRPVVIAAEADEVLRDFLARNDALPRDGEFVYVGESRQARDNPDLGEDEHLPADLDLTIVQLELPSKRHVHTHAMHSICVTVEFNAQTPTRRFSPNTTVDTVLVWAKRRLNIDPVAGADLVLELVPSAEIPRMDEYLGDLLSAGQHELKFKLVKEVNPQGACA